jgi:HTH-type transcriptional regulator, competence development regulator
MNFGEYIRNLRNEKKLSQRELAEKAGISNAEISRLESGDRKKPSPITLKAIAPFLEISYQELLKQAGYIEEMVERPGYTERIYKDENGKLIDITRKAADLYDKNVKWANIAFRVTSSDLSEDELNVISAQTESLLQQFLKNKEERKK